MSSWITASFGATPVPGVGKLEAAVIPATAGIHALFGWKPACAGMTPEMFFRASRRPVPDPRRECEMISQAASESRRISLIFRGLSDAFREHPDGIAPTSFQPAAASFLGPRKIQYFDVRKLASAPATEPVRLMVLPSVLVPVARLPVTEPR